MVKSRSRNQGRKHMPLLETGVVVEAEGGAEIRETIRLAIALANERQWKRWEVWVKWNWLLFKVRADSNPELVFRAYEIARKEKSGSLIIIGPDYQP